MSEDETEDDYATVVHAGRTAFIHFPGEGGGRLIPTNHIKSIVPDFHGTGSMVFLVGLDKAVKVIQTPEEIANDLVTQAAEAE